MYVQCEIIEHREQQVTARGEAPDARGSANRVHAAAGHKAGTQ